MLEKTYDAKTVEPKIAKIVGRGGRLPRRRRRRRGRRSLHHRHSAAERHRLAAHGPCAQQHAAGHPGPLRAHARQERAVAAGHGPCRHRHPDGGRAQADGEADPSPRPDARAVRREGLGVEGRIRRHDLQPAEAARRLVRLVARALHHGRGPVEGGPRGVRHALQAGPDLQGQAPCELGPEAADRDLRPRGRADEVNGNLWHFRYPVEGETYRSRRDPRATYITVATTRPETMLGDTGVAVHPDDERYAGIWSARTSSCRSSAARSRSSPTNIPIRRRAPARSRSRRRTTSTTSRSASATICRRSTS